MGSGSSKKASTKPEKTNGLKSKPQPSTAQPQKNAEPQMEEQLPWFTLLSQVAKEELWGGVSRAERTEWNEYLTLAGKVAKKDIKEIPQDVTRQILVGNLEHNHTISSIARVLVFVSSTFTDTQAERDILMKDVYPFIRTVCRRLGLDFGTVDMRWGVTEEATNDHSVVQLCEEELQRCLKTSCGPAFLGIVSHKYGYRMLPALIEKTELETMMAYLINNDKETEAVKKLYHLDKNSVEQEYVLAPISSMDKDTWWESAEKVLDLLREASTECFDRQAEHVKKFFVSVTETEMQSGVFKNPKKDDQVVIVQRVLEDVMSEFNLTRKLLDMKSGKVDEYAQDKLKELKERLTATCDSLKTFRYEEATVERCRNSVRDLCDYVCKSLLDKIFDQYSKLSGLTSDNLLEEISQHHIQIVEKKALFVGKEEELQAIQSYLQNDSPSTLVIHGLSGCGKTTLMAVAASQALEHVPGCALVFRFLGTTPNSCTGRSMLLSICEQISRIYMKGIPEIPNSLKELEKYVYQCFQYANKDLPLLIFFDSLDQLADDDAWQSVGWMLSEDKLPKHVRLVVSTLPSPVLTRLQNKLKEDKLIRVNKLLPAEGPQILSKMLASKGRKIHEDQLSTIMTAFLGCPLPLYLRLAADLALRWHSYDIITSESVARDVAGMITGIYVRLENKYGKEFVHHALAYITAAKAGLSESELEDIMSCDDEVLDILFKWWQPPVRCMPKLLWARLRTDLGAYLVERGSEGISMYRWYHRQFWETATDRYLDKPFDSDPRPFRETAHAAIADYFDNKWADGKLYPNDESKKNKEIKPKLEPRGIQEQPYMWSGHGKGSVKWNRRKLYELPYHVIKTENWNRFLDLVSNLQYIKGKFAAGYGYDCYKELTEASKRSGLVALKQITRFVGSNLAFLQSEPSNVYQLASQQADTHPLKKSMTMLDKTELPFAIMQGLGKSENDLCELTLQGHTKSVYSCHFSRKGDLIVSTSEDGTLCIWDALTGEVLSTLSSLPEALEPDSCDGKKMITHHVNPCSFSPVDDVIAVGTETGEIMLLDTNGQQLKIEYTENMQVTSVKFSPDKAVLASSFKNGKVYVWNAETLEHLHTVQLEHIVTDLSFSPDGSILAVACMRGLALVNTDSYTIQSFTLDKASKAIQKTRRASRNFHTVLCCAFHPAGKLVMTGSTDSHLGVWDAQTGECLEKVEGHWAWIWDIQFTHDGQYMFTASSDRSVMVWQSKDDTWQSATSLYGHSHRIVSLVLDPSSESVLVTASLDCTLKVWDISSIKTGKHEPMSEPNSMRLLYNTLTLSPSTESLLMSQGWSTCCDIRPWRGEKLDFVRTPLHHNGYIRTAKFVHDGSRVVTLDHGHYGDFEVGSARKAQVIVCSAQDGVKLKVLSINSDSDGDSKDGPTALGISQNFIVVGTVEGVVMLFDINTYEKVKFWQTEDEVSTISCSMKDDHVLTTTGTGATLWKVSSTEIQCIKGPLSISDSKVTVSAFSPLGNMFAVGYKSGQVGLWRLTEDVVLAKSLAAHKSEVKDLAFSASGSYLATCGDHRVQIWAVQGKIEMKSAYFAPVTCVVFKEENLLLAGDSMGKLHELTFE